jgi:lipoprotein-anchoring transpeptidase ErfK/SrfK
MRVPSIITRALTLVSASVILAMAMPAMAHAQLVDFLWGGDSEWGGQRSIVRFDQKYRPGQLIASFGDRRLYLVTKPGTAISYPIAVPREQSRWQGRLNVTQKRENPSWTPTPEMLRENPRLPAWVPGGHPMNPLGVRALYLGSSTYRIHGTDAPWTIGQAVSKGCIRMYNEDVLDLYPRVPVGTVVTVTWERFKTGAAAVETASTPPAASGSKVVNYGRNGEKRTKTVSVQ